MKKTVLSHLSDYLIAGIMMAFAWSLRGQFGHLKGALIPGAVSAVIMALLMPGQFWRESLGRAVILAAIGFAVGGHMGYGKLFESVISSASLFGAWRGILRIFFTGALWGGLGCSFLAFGFSEKPFRAMDLCLLVFLGALWLILLGVFDLESYDRLLFAAGFAAIHFYNAFWKRSIVISLLAISGVLGFGSGFAFSAVFLYMGRHGYFGGGWDWWNLRDQIIGLFAGASLWFWASILEGFNFRREQFEKIADMQRIGFIVYASIIPALSAFNVLLHWISLNPSEMAWRLSGAAFLFQGIVLAVLLFKDEMIFLNPAIKRTLLVSTLIFFWYLSVIAIAKQVFIFGWNAWEPAYAFFAGAAVFLTVFLPFKLRDV